MTETLRASIYARISDKKNSAQKIQDQIQQCRTYAAKKGYDVDESLIFIDEAISGLGHKHREQFDQLMDALLLGKVDVIVATEEERFARNVQDKADLTAACNEVGAKWDTLRDGEVDPASDTGEFFAIMRAAMGRMETRRDSARAKEANATKRDAGLPTPGRRVYGYKQDGMTPRKEEAVVVKRIFDAVLAGDSIRSITKGLIEDGIEPTTGTGWSNRRIRDMVMNPRYGGALSHKGEIIESKHVKAIVKPKRAAAARALLADEKRRTTPGPGVRHLMSGIAVCGVCGSSMYFMRDYRCRADSSHPSIQKKSLDPKVEAEVIAALLLGGPALNALDPDAAAIAPLTASLARNEAEVAQVVADRSDALLTPAVARVELLRLKSEREAVERQLDEARERSAIASLLLDLRLRVIPGTQTVSIEDAVSMKKEIRARWAALDLDPQRTLVRALVDVRVSPGRKPERVSIEHRIVRDLNEAADVA